MRVKREDTMYTVSPARMKERAAAAYAVKDKEVKASAWEDKTADGQTDG